MITSFFHAFTIIAYLYNTLVLTLSIIINPNWFITSFSILSIISYCFSTFMIIGINIEIEEKIFRFAKILDKRYHGLVAIYNISIYAVIFNILLHILMGMNVLNTFEQETKFYDLVTPIYIVLSTLPLSGWIIITITLFIIIVPCIIGFLIAAFVKFAIVVVDIFFACRETYREVYCDIGTKAEVKTKSLNDTEPLNKIVKSE